MTLKPVEEAVHQVTAGLSPVTSEVVALPQALGRVLASDVVVGRDQPPFDASAMDGYAVRAADVENRPVTLKLTGTAPAGGAFVGTVGPGEAVRVFTGAPIPEGADKVIVQEDTEADGNQVTVVGTGGDDRYIRPRGLDFTEGQMVLPKGTRLTARGVALAASANQPWLNVRRKPQVAVLATGDELVLPGGTLRDDQIISSNNFALAALIETFGGEAHDLGIGRDDIDDLVDKARGAVGADILVTIGGASVGDHDLVQKALSKAGLKVDFWRIAMRPGKPLMFGELGPIKVLGLPGNPVSALVCARIFLKPMLNTLLGIKAPESELERAQLGGDLPANNVRQAYLRATLEVSKDGLPIATPYESQDSAMLRMLHNADCLIVRPPHAKPAEKGEPVDILRLDF